MATKKKKEKKEGGFDMLEALTPKSNIENIVEGIHSKKPPPAKITELEAKPVETKIEKVKPKDYASILKKKVTSGEISQPKDETKKKKRPWWKPLTMEESKLKKEKTKKERKAKSVEAKAKAYKKKTKGPMTYGEKEKAERSARDFKRPAAATQSQYATELVDVKKSPATIPGQKTRVVKTEKTKGGEYPYAKPGSETASSFNKTFRDERKAGKKTFTWQGRSYSTRQAGESKWDAETGKWTKKGAKKQMGGPVSDRPFRQGIKYYKGGGQVTTTNNKAASGDIVNVHSHSGYKAGE